MGWSSRPVFKVERARRGYNPHRRKVPSYYPITAHLAETTHVLRVRNRSGNVHDSKGSVGFLRELASLTPCLRASSIAFAPASSCFRIAMIFSSENRGFFIRVLPGGKLYSRVVLIVRGLQRKRTCGSCHARVGHCQALIQGKASTLHGVGAFFFAASRRRAGPSLSARRLLSSDDPTT